MERLAIPIASTRRALNTLWEKVVIQRERRQEGNKGYFLYWTGALKVSIDQGDRDRVPRSAIAVQNPELPDLDRRDRQNDENFTNDNKKDPLFTDRRDRCLVNGDHSDRGTPITVPSDHGLIENSDQPIAVAANSDLRRLVVYKGTNQALIRVCGRKHLEILSETPTCAEVRHPNWLVTQSIPLIDLKPAK